MPKHRTIEPRAIELLEAGPGIWIEFGDSFIRQRQAHRDLPGYETSEAYKARGGGDTISLFWLDYIYLVDRPGQYIRDEAEKLRGLQILKDHLMATARRLREI